MGSARLSFKIKGGASEAKMKLQVFDAVMGDYWTDLVVLPIEGRSNLWAKKVRGAFLGNRENLEVYGSAALSGTPVARLLGGAAVPADYEVGEAYRVDLGGELKGFVAKSAMKRAAGVKRTCIRQRPSFGHRLVENSGCHPSSSSPVTRPNPTKPTKLTI